MVDGLGVPGASCPSCSEPEAFGGVEGGVVERLFGGVVGGFLVCLWRGWVCVSVRVFERDFLQEEKPFDGSTLVGDGHASVVAQQVPDLGVESFEA